MLKAKYDKSVETIGLIKQYLQEVFEEIDVDRETIERLSTCTPNRRKLFDN